jgi:hypothetical protein
MTAARIALVAVLVLALFACTVQPVAPVRPANVENLENRARTEVERGNSAAAAELYSQLAVSAGGVQRADYLIAAARAYIDAGDTASARRRLLDARPNADRERQQSIVTLLARIEVEQGRPQAALDMLAELVQPIGVPVLRDAAAVRGRAWFRLGRPIDAIRALVEREVWLDDAAAIRDNQQLIWDGLREPSLPAAIAPTGDATIDGWLALAPLARRGADAADLRRDLLAWRETYTDHPAAGGLLADLLSAQRATGFPAQIALLLPMSSTARNEALALRDGFLAAHLRSMNAAGTSVRVYDTGLLGSTEAYLRAQLEGADFIVGPLLRDDVEAVIAQAGFVPTLALNFAPSATSFSSSFYQFALAPTDSARMAAQHAAAAGATTAVALVPSTDRGYLLRDTFRAEFEALGGQLLDFSGYDPSTQDFSGPITAIFNIARSNQRYRRLAANLGTRVEFEARRRDDVDLIFLGADSRTGRLLAPQLRFNSVGDIPMYATSDIFDAVATARDNDLNGVIFADAPALVAPDQNAAALRAELQVYWPQRSDQMRFYGMGFDAYQLVGLLYDSGGARWPLRGMSGDLTLDVDGRIRRALPLAQFRNGRPVALEPIPERAREVSELAGFR